MKNKGIVAPALVSIQKIWDHALHCSMTDLIRFKNLWFCVFRESDSHAKGKNGSIRLLMSSDSLEWHTAAVFAQEGVDLRDPKLSITPHGMLMLLVGGTILNDRFEYLSTQSRVAFSEDGMMWSPFTLILEPHEWLWRVTWHQGKAYGAAYGRTNPNNKYEEWFIKLFESSNGLDFVLLTQWDIQGYPNETTLRFLKSGEMFALVRREKPEDNACYTGISSPPYTFWTWSSTQHHVGGPNFIVLPYDNLCISGRLVFNSPYACAEKTFLGSLEFGSVLPLILLPSFGDCSYPGMVFHDNLLWISYYSSHENGKAAIYLARVKF